MQSLRAPAVAALTLIAVVFAGCAGGDGDSTTSPTGTGGTGGTGNTTSPSPTDGMAPPGQAYSDKKAWSQQASPALSKMSISQGWKALNINWFVNATSQCYVLTAGPAAPPSQGPPPSLTVTAPSGTKTTMSSFPTGPGGCGQGAPPPAMHNVGKGTASVVSELGDWTWTATGIGTNVELQVVVMGS